MTPTAAWRTAGACSAALALALAGCRKDAPPTEGAGGSREGGVVDAARAGAGGSREARAGLPRRDAGIDPACAGAELALLVAAADVRCAVTEREYALLAGDDGAADAGGARLRQEARREGDGVVLSLVNASGEAILVPLRFHPDRRDRAFSVIAEDRDHALYELAPPSVEAGGLDDAGAASSPARAGPIERDGSAGLVHSARVRLAPGGRASVRLVIDPRVVARIHPPCGAEAGACAPARLPGGSYTLHIGQLVAAVDTGAPARVAWDRP